MPLSTKKPIATNLITGFLGVGKTTAIKSLLARKPVNERWAVLINEFGEIGIDADLIGKDQSEQTGIVMREIFGGCMCCATGVPMQVALNQLIKEAKPDRLLIEPTGLGHPKEILRTLSEQHYQSILAPKATLTLVDARNIKDERYRTSELYLNQLSVADVIVANKSDLYQPNDLDTLILFLQTKGWDDKPIVSASQGEIELQWLDKPNRHLTSESHHHHHDHSSDDALHQLACDTLPASGYFRKDNQIDEFASSSWLFDQRFQFDAQCLRNLFHQIPAERMKGIFRTPDGIIALNMSNDVLSESNTGRSDDSRVVVIGRDSKVWNNLEQLLLDCANGR